MPLKHARGPRHSQCNRRLFTEADCRRPTMNGVLIFSRRPTRAWGSKDVTCWTGGKCWLKEQAFSNLMSGPYDCLLLLG
ncbi:Small RNA degrading nuclease 2 [Fusarium oxysporum f. sp. albedinis]|nr:Small RNA degrading nuclease 2 [Fusarium oxysporum f. sp. albedinis]